MRFALPSLFLPAVLTLVSSISPVYADYIADMVIFEHRTTETWLEEYWPLLPLKLESSDHDIALGPDIAGFGWKWRNAESSAMRNAEQRLTQNGAYRTLAKVSWVQPTQNKDKGKVAVFETKHPDNGGLLQARVFIHKQKFEHIQIEAQVEKTIPIGVRELFALKNKQPLETLPETWRFTLSESRKLTPGELNYFDHPQFGVLLLLTSLEAS
jgi:hypothetical protein